MESLVSVDALEVGVDEAGRGCLMGRVYAGACILHMEPTDEDDKLFGRIRDSKKLSVKIRNQLNTYIRDNALAFGIGYADVEEVDTVNIRNASMIAMHRALDQIQLDYDTITVDGDWFRPYYRSGVRMPFVCIEDGDNKYRNIAAAAILAKHARDEWVSGVCAEHPEWASQYGWAKNMGYGTAVHMEGLRKHGVTPLHRMTFAPCRRAAGLPVRPKKFGSAAAAAADGHDTYIVLDDEPERSPIVVHSPSDGLGRTPQQCLLVLK
jgi:ribonuclease HII